ncbi:MAG TPA: hypothetical protein VHC22_00195 [Pirellulales bacterium]|nr:hypothetical protein [Pirellulales bacterium]
MRFSLRWVFAIVLFAAIGCGALLRASWLLSEALASAAGALLICAIIGSIYTRGPTAAFFGGCAIGGCVYFLCYCLPPDAPFCPSRLADKATRDLYQAISREVPAVPQNGAYPEGTHLNKGRAFVRRPPWNPFETAARVLATFAVAIAGGIVARTLYLRSARNQS